MFFVLSKEANT